jgi:alkylation response protein AidB-like acyl-CoA dehydrogenase
MKAVEFSRNTFGKPIFAHQAVSFMLADMATEIQAARHLVPESAWLHDNGDRNTKQAAMAKRFAADMCNRLTTNAFRCMAVTATRKSSRSRSCSAMRRSSKSTREGARFSG